MVKQPSCFALPLITNHKLVVCAGLQPYKTWVSCCVCSDTTDTFVSAVPLLQWKVAHLTCSIFVEGLWWNTAWIIDCSSTMITTCIGRDLPWSLKVVIFHYCEDGALPAQVLLTLHCDFECQVSKTGWSKHCSHALLIKMPIVITLCLHSLHSKYLHYGDVNDSKVEHVDIS